jgi:hypothetical protein
MHVCIPEYKTESWSLSARDPRRRYVPWTMEVSSCGRHVLWTGLNSRWGLSEGRPSTFPENLRARREVHPTRRNSREWRAIEQRNHRQNNQPRVWGPGSMRHDAVSLCDPGEIQGSRVLPGRSGMRAGSIEWSLERSNLRARGGFRQSPKSIFKEEDERGVGHYP